MASARPLGWPRLRPGVPARLARREGRRSRPTSGGGGGPLLTVRKGGWGHTQGPRGKQLSEAGERDHESDMTYHPVYRKNNSIRITGEPPRIINKIEDCRIVDIAGKSISGQSAAGEFGARKPLESFVHSMDHSMFHSMFHSRDISFYVSFYVSF